MTIAKLTSGTGFRGILNYLEQKVDNDGKPRPEATPIGGTIPGDTARDKAASFSTLRSFRPDRNDFVRHLSFRWTEQDAAKLNGDHGTQAQMAEQVADRMDWDAWTAYSHGDHVHIVASVINYDGTKAPDAWTKYRAEEAMRELERDFGLEAVAPSQDADFKAPTSKEIKQFERTGEPSTKARIQSAVAEAMQEEPKCFSDFAEACERQGLVVDPVVQSTGRIPGYSLRHSEDPQRAFKASDIGRGFTMKGLEKKGITYDRDQEIDRVRGLQERTAALGLHGEGYAGRAGGPESGPEPARAATPERGGSGPEHPAPDRHAGGHEPPRQHGDLGANPEAGRGEPQDHQGRAGPRGEGVATPEIGGQRGAESGVSGASDPRNGRAANDPAGQNGPDRVSGGSGSRSGGSVRGTGLSALNRAYSGAQQTLAQIGRAVAAYGAAKFGVSFYNDDRDDLKPHTREYTADQMADPKTVSYMRAQNAKGYNVAFRQEPDANGKVAPWAMVDDLDAQGIQRLEDAGLRPNLVVETSPGKHQAHIKLDAYPMKPETLGIAQKCAAELAGGDPGASSDVHWRRVPGLTNTKPERQQDNGLPPFAKIAHDNGDDLPERGMELAEASEEARKRDLEQKRKNAAAQRVQADNDQRAKAPTPDRQQAGEWAKAKKKELGIDDEARWMKQYHAPRPMEPRRQTAAETAFLNFRAQAARHTNDDSAMDWRAAKEMKKQGFDVGETAHAIEAKSPRLAERKPGRTDTYAEDTARKAHKKPTLDQQVREQNEERAHNQGLTSGPKPKPNFTMGGSKTKTAKDRGDRGGHGE